MNCIVEIPVSQKERWNCIARSIKDHDIFYLDEYINRLNQCKGARI